MNRNVPFRQILPILLAVCAPAVLSQIANAQTIYRRMVIGLVATSLLLVGAMPAGDWDLRRNVGNGACFVQPSKSSSVGVLLKTHPTRKAACEDAKARHTDDAADTSKCFTYTTGTKDECKKEGVELND